MWGHQGGESAVATTHMVDCYRHRRNYIFGISFYIGFGSQCPLGVGDGGRANFPDGTQRANIRDNALFSVRKRPPQATVTASAAR